MHFHFFVTKFIFVLLIHYISNNINPRLSNLCIHMIYIQSIYHRQVHLLALYICSQSWTVCQFSVCIVDNTAFRSLASSTWRSAHHQHTFHADSIHTAPDRCFSFCRMPRRCTVTSSGGSGILARLPQAFSSLRMERSPHLSFFTEAWLL